MRYKPSTLNPPFVGGSRGCSRGRVFWGHIALKPLSSDLNLTFPCGMKQV